MKKIYFLLFICFFFSGILTAQDATLDSLWQVYEAQPQEEKKIILLTDIAYVYRLNHPDSCVYLAQEALERAQKINFDRGKAWAFNRIGVGYQVLGKLARVLENLQNAERIFRRIDDEPGLAATYLQMGTFHSAEKEYQTALKDYKMALELYQKNKNEDYVVRTLNNIGTTYYYQKSYSDALIYYQKALTYHKVEHQPLVLAIIKNNIGLCYVGEQKYDIGIETLWEANAIFKQLNDAKNVGENYYWVAYSYAQYKDYPTAQKYALEALALSQKAKNTITVNRTAKLLVEISQEQKDYQKALTFYELFYKTNDSLYNTEKAKLIASLKANAELEKKDLEISNQKKVNDVQRFLNYLTLFFLIVALGLIYLTYRSRLKETRAKMLLRQQNEQILKQSEELKRTNDILQASQQAIVSQNQELQEQSEELIRQKAYLEQVVDQLEIANEKIKSNELMLLNSMDKLQKREAEITRQNLRIQQSLKAGLTIQEAILPQAQTLKQLFKDHFVLNLPKDTVSGDFYWVEQTEDKLFIAVVDCTGHGVPGAFMSMIGNTLLDRIVIIQKIYSPSEILTRLNQEIQKSLKQETQLNNYGMDMVIVVMEKEKEAGQASKINFSGAKNPIYYYKPLDKQLHISKGDRKPLGGFQKNDTPFTQTELLLDPGDILYLATDGYIDQNDQHRKKLGFPKLKSLLESNAHLDLAQQKNILWEALLEHQTGTEQRDDILMMGIKV